jgi:hypothetical protein
VGRETIISMTKPDELASRFADPAAQEAMACVQGSLREELEAPRTVWQ